MQTSVRQKTNQALIFLAVAAVVLAADQASKAWVLEALATASRPVVIVLPGLLRFEYAENRGAAFSMFQEHPGVLTVVAALLAVFVLVWALFFLRPEERVARLSLALVLGGALGNLIDRFRHSFVVDFIVAHWKGHAWPTFNIADAAICVGIGVFFIVSLKAGKKETEKEEEKAPADTP
ncbi:MAG: signal peptidase II [Candidatus Sumerlaeota bacterium]